MSAARVPPGAPTIVEGLYSFQIGGSEKLGALLAREFAARGYRVVALSFFDHEGPVRSELEAAGIECDGLGVATRSRLQRLALRGELREWFREHRPAALHLHHGVTAIRAARAARTCGVPRIVLTEHSARQLRAEPRYRRALRSSLGAIDHVTVVNDELRAYFQSEFGVPPSRLAVLANPVDPRYAELARDSVARAALGLGDAWVLAFVGRLVPEKSVDVLLEAVRRARRETAVDLRLVVAGDGPLRGSLEELARGLDLGGAVTWLGAQGDATRALALADAFVLASQSEGLPMALLEAMAAGVPCIATAVGGIPAALAGDAGLVVPPLQPAALAAAIVRVARDSALAQSLAARARRAVAEHHALARIADAYLEYLGLPLRMRDDAA